jgi:hypothetical protein
MADNVDVRRLRLQPGDSLVLTTPEGMNVPDARRHGEQLRRHLDELGHAEVDVLVVTGGCALFTIPGAERDSATSG